MFAIDTSAERDRKYFSSTVQGMTENNSSTGTDLNTTVELDLSRSPWSFVQLFGGYFSCPLAFEWMEYHWTKSFYLAAYYLFCIYLGQQWMKGREKFDLRILLVCWNLSLAIFSIMGFLQLFPGFISLLYTQGLSDTVCVRGLDDTKNGFWIWLFALSKVVEFGDTAFIVLRKQKLIFLHWYHHITVLIFTWYGCVAGVGPGKWFVVMNYAVHSAMYSYYTLRALRLHLPRCIPMSVTCIQLAQMFLGACVSLIALSVKRRGKHCDQTDQNLTFALILYSSYFMLFGYFFVKVYFCSEGKFVKLQDKKEN